MEKLMKARDKMLKAFLKSIRKTAERGAGRASYKGMFEAKVPDSLKNRK